MLIRRRVILIELKGFSSLSSTSSQIQLTRWLATRILFWGWDLTLPVSNVSRLNIDASKSHFLVGALKATGNRGLQPAMDHILENESKPVPSVGNVSESSAPASSAMDVDQDEEDAEALQSLGGVTANAVEAKVHTIHTISLFRNECAYSWTLEYQVLRVWQNLQEHGSRRISR